MKENKINLQYFKHNNNNNQIEFKFSQPKIELKYRIRNLRNY